MASHTPSTRAIVVRTSLAVVVAVAAFHAALVYPWGKGLILVFCAGLWYGTALRPRHAFLLGTAVSFACVAPQLAFLHDIFGPFAISLWLVLAGWTGLWMAGVAWLRRQSLPFWAVALLAAWSWGGLEHIRGDSWPLRFSWLTSGWVLGDHELQATFGVYGLGALVMLAAIAVLGPGTTTTARGRAWPGWLRGLAALVLMALFSLPGSLQRHAGDEPGPLVVGIQTERAVAEFQRRHLQAAITAHPEADILVLSEYALPQGPPDWLGPFAMQHRVHLVVGTKTSSAAGEHNTVQVYAPDGRLVHEQVKSQPIQFFDDGLPARQRRVWQSPWGAIGIAICYDLSYAWIMDELVEQGAELLLIPTMDVLTWGEHEHELHARQALSRATEYRMPIIRVCSSGISQWVDADGQVRASAPFPGYGERLIARPTPQAGRVPPLRQVIWLGGWLGLALFAAAIIASCTRPWRRLRRRTASVDNN